MSRRKKSIYVYCAAHGPYDGDKCEYCEEEKIERLLPKILLNAQRTVQAFRKQIAENTKWSDLAGQQLIGLAEKNILITRERDNARAEGKELKRVMGLLLQAYYAAHNMIGDEFGGAAFEGDNLTILAEKLIK